jgi:hypothetical protein
VIKNFLKAAALIAAFTGGAAQASTFDFSYTFADGLALTGSLNGTLNGTLVTDVSGITVAFNGTKFVGPLFAGNFNAASNSWDFSSGAAVISTNAAQNNFIFADSSDPQGNNVTNYFYFLTSASTSGPQVLAANTNVLVNNSDFDGPPNGTWSITAAAVPVPAALPLLLSGLGILGLKRRRRLQGDVAHA